MAQVVLKIIQCEWNEMEEKTRITTKAGTTSLKMTSTCTSSASPCDVINKFQFHWSSVLFTSTSAGHWVCWGIWGDVWKTSSFLKDPNDICGGVWKLSSLLKDPGGGCEGAWNSWFPRKNTVCFCSGAWRSWFLLNDPDGGRQCCCALNSCTTSANAAIWNWKNNNL